MAGPNIDWDYSFPYSDGPGPTGYFEEGWSGEIRVQMTVIIPDDGQDYMFSWWQNFGGGRYDQPLSPGQNDLDFVLSDAGYQHDLIRALVFRDGGTSGVSVEIPTEPVVTEIVPLQANDDEATTNADTPVTVDVLANDTIYGEPAALDQLEGPPTIHQQPANGTVSVAPDGKITYTPNPGFTGTDEFVYRIAMPVHEPECPELRFTNGGIHIDDLRAAFPGFDSDNIYFEYYGYYSIFYEQYDGWFYGEWMPCDPVGEAMDPYPWQVDVFWGDGGGGMCAMIYNECS